MAFTLIDMKTGRSVRVSLKPEFFEQALNSPFVQQRKEGVPPQDIPAEIADPIVNKVVTMPVENFLNIGPVKEEHLESGKGIFDAKRCESCGELTFINKLQEDASGKTVCIPCSQA